MLPGDYFWGEYYQPFKLIDRQGNWLFVAERRFPMSMLRVRGWVKVGEEVMWLPFSNNWKKAIVLDRPQLTVQLKNGSIHPVPYAKVLKVEKKLDTYVAPLMPSKRFVLPLERRDPTEAIIAAAYA